MSYDGAGHLVVTPPYLPATVNHARHPVAKLDFAFGGSPARVISFLRRVT